MGWSCCPKRGLRAALLASSCLIGAPALAVDSTWTSVGDTSWNNNANWSPDPGAGGPTTADTATFINNGAVTSVVISTAVSPVAISFGAGAPTYTITLNQGLTLSGASIVNNSGTAQNIVVSSGVNFTIIGAGGLGSATITTDVGGAFSLRNTITGGTARIVNNGTFNVRRASSTTATIGSLEGSGLVRFQAVPGNTFPQQNLTVGSLNTDTEFSGVIEEGVSVTGSLAKVGTGRLILSGISTYVGSTTVSGGTLAINGSIATSSLTTVDSGGTLGGIGTVGDTTISSGGTLAPGNSIGTLTINGNLTLNAGSTYAIEVSPSSADRTNVTGIAVLGGATVAASFASGSYISKQYTILNATGGRNGTFGAQVNTNLPSNVTTALSYDANNAYLDLTLSFSSPAAPNFGNGLSGNQNNVANAITGYFNSNGGIPAAFASLDGNGLSQASGQPGASASQTGVGTTTQFVNAIFSNAFGGGTGGNGALGFAQADEQAYAAKPKLSRAAQEAYAAVTPRDRQTPAFGQRWNVWASVYGGNNRVGGHNAAGTSTTTSKVYGAVAGADYRFTRDTQAGFALGGAGSSFSIDGGFGSGKADIFNAAVYAKHNIGAAYLAGALSYSWQDTSTDRTVNISGVDRLTASFKAQAFTARLEGGWRYATPMLGVTPYGALQSTTFFMPAYGESATSGSNQFALSYASKTTTNLRTEMGAKFDKAMLVQGGVFTLTGRAAWAHDSNTDSSATATFQSLPGATFTTNGATPSPNGALLSLGGEMAWHNGWSLAANFDGEFSRTTTAYSGKGTLRYAW